MENSSKKEKFSAILLVVSAVMILFAPYKSDSTLTLHTELLGTIFKYSIYAFAILNTIIIIFPYIKGKKLSMTNLLQVLPMLAYFLLSSFYTYDNKFVLSGFLFLWLWILYAMAPKEIQLLTFKYLKRVWVIASIFGIIFYLNYILDLFIPYKEVDYYNASSLGVFAKYIDYKFIFLYQETTGGGLISYARLCGFCNEPGYFGTFCAFFLCASCLNLKDKSNIILLIAGFLTYSLGFILIIILFIILKNIKKLKTMVFVVIILLAYFFVLPNITTGNQNIDHLLQRMTITENGLSGDNRSIDEVDILFTYTLENKPLFGYGNNFLKSQSFEGGYATYKSYVIQYGIIGCLLFWGLLFYAAIYKNTKNFYVIIFILIYFIDIYQRPNIMYFQYQIMLFGGILYLEEIVKNKKLKKTDENMIEVTEVAEHLS